MSMHKVTRRQTMALMGASALAGVAGPLLAETGYFADRVAKGALPDVASRLPKSPRVVDVAAMGRTPGRQGGTVRTLIGGQRDIRYMPIIGYSRLVGYDPKFNFVADIAERYEVEDDRIFTFHLREGHRWSDGNPFTAEDFRYFWEDVASNQVMYPGSVPTEYLVDGKPPVFEVVDPLTVRFTWPTPAPEFLPNLAAPVPTRVFMPSAYLKGFHPDYATPEAIAVAIKAEKVDDWVSLHQKLSRSNRPENPDLPTLEPWVPRTTPPADQFVFERNPFFHRVDAAGVQLPYVDRFVMNISSSEIIGAKAATGDADLQFTALDFADYTLLKQAEATHPIKVALWKRVQGSRVALMPNLNCTDAGWQAFMRDVRVRRAMSLAVNRAEINTALFYGLGVESADTLLPESPLYKPEYAAAYATYDPDEGNRLLDEAGYDKRGPGGLRMLPDGRPCNIIVESAGESTLETDVLQLIRDQFRKIGLAIFPRSSERDVFRSRALGGDIVMSVWQGIDNGVATADMPPGQLAPTLDDQLQWPLWGMYFLSNGQKGSAPDMPEVAALVDLFRQWRQSETTQERTAIWTRMLEIHADQVYTIGTVNGTLQPIVSMTWLRNVPEEALYGYDPTSYLGVYMPDTFWADT